ncbi:uncharacterized protein [Amphiura filiformis]|uniref:uncharacterized protein n=1 Tax=Amphiura filiformis TaxID=82378 RepID=UPI003B20F313
MDMPRIHQCLHMSAENERMFKKLKKLKKRNSDLENELKSITDRLKIEQLLRERVTTRSVSVQTDPPGYRPYTKPPSAVAKKEDTDKKKADRLLSMHNKLMKRYERELKHNITHTETIAALNLRIQELERQLSQAREQLRLFERATPSRRRSMVRRRRSSSTSPLDNSLDLKSELAAVKKERDDLAREKRKMKKELGALDEGFFEEIEDLKYALQQSAKLNKEYEKTLKKICKQYGVPFPFNNKENRSPSKRRRRSASQSR